MPFTYEISPQDQVAYVTISGPVDLRSTIRMMGELGKDPAFSPDYKVVVDATNMEYSPSLGELRACAVSGQAVRDAVAAESLTAR